MSVATQVLLAALGGGFGIKALEKTGQWVGIISGSQSQFRQDMASRVNHLQDRVQNLEEQLREEIWARMKAEAMLMRLINSHNAMRQEQGLDEITYEDLEQSTLDPRQMREDEDRPW